MEDTIPSGGLFIWGGVQGQLLVVPWYTPPGYPPDMQWMHRPAYSVSRLPFQEGGGGACRSLTYYFEQGMGGDVQGGIHPICSDRQTKMYGGSTLGGIPPTGGRGGRIQGIRGVPIQRKVRLALTSVKIHE